jgi:hypothetical protein
MEVMLHPMPMEQPKFENWHIHIWSHYVLQKLANTSVPLKRRKNNDNV